MTPSASLVIGPIYSRRLRTVETGQGPACGVAGALFAVRRFSWSPSQG